MKRLYLALILPCILLSLPAVAEQFMIQPQTQGEVTFVSGGVGFDERNEMQAIRADYNLHLLFSITGTGEYLSDVQVLIRDAKGNVYLEAVSDGPMLFARLSPGRYLVTADHDGQLIQKWATVGKQRASLYFRWPE